jgi:TRAP-type C4-dicarboxylate transport system substrate-binding protein
MTVINLDTFNGLGEAHRNLLVAQGLKYERLSDAVIAEKSAVDNERLAAAGLRTIELKGAARRAYLDTIYSAKWAENDAQQYNVDYQLLKSKVYARPGS